MAAPPPFTDREEAFLRALVNEGVPFLVVGLAAGVSAQTELWVDPQLGSNGNTGTFSQPLQTLDAAVAAAGAGDRIHLLPGTYGPTFAVPTLDTAYGLELVDQLPLTTPPNSNNIGYLRTKKDKLGHLLGEDELRPHGLREALPEGRE